VPRSSIVDYPTVYACFVGEGRSKGYEYILGGINEIAVSGDRDCMSIVISFVIIVAVGAVGT
jgi:hypothetical protein